MIVFSAGMKKSGSTWSFHLINQLLTAAGHQDAFQTLRFLPKAATLRRPYNLQLLLATIPHWSGKTYTIKSHTKPLPVVKWLVANGAMRIVYSYRDPRDAALSMLDFGKRLRKENRLIHPKAAEIFTVEQAIQAMEAQLKIWAAWKAYPHVLMIRYEDLKEDLKGQLLGIIAYLDLNVSDEELTKITERYRQDAMSPDMQNNLKFNKGQTKRYLHEMTAGQLELSEKVFSPYLSKMGYERYSSKISAVQGS